MSKNSSKMIFLSFVLVLFSIFSVTSVYPQEFIENTKAPEFNLVDLEGNSISLSDSSGKVTALFFWATWCPYCRNETAKLIKLKQEFKDEDLEILAINYREDIDKLKQFAIKRGINYRILLDKKGEVFKLYNIPGVPALIIVDRKGLIQYNDSELPKNYREIFERLLK